MFKQNLKLPVARLVATIAMASTLLLLPGCKTNDGGNSRVTIKSEPEGATVFRGDEALGTTPLKLTLDPNDSHSFVLKKLYFNDTPGYISPQPNEKSQNLVKFGPLESAGYYVDLLPNPLIVEMEPEIIPNGVGANPLGEMAAIVYRVDQLLKDRKINRREHKYIVDKISDFYENQTEY